MANSKIRTLWNIKHRVRDSREILDAVGGLKAGRVDIPASQAVEAEGYSKVEYHLTMSDGTAHTLPTFKDVIESLTGVVESKAGSGVMTFYFPQDKQEHDYFGLWQIDVYKEWEDEDPEPEPEPLDPIVRVASSFHADGFGFNAYQSSGKRISVKHGGFAVNFALKDADIIKDLTNRVQALEAALLGKG